MIGQTVSHYKILERLGEGGMGVVYKAQDTHLDRTVALKFLPPHLSRSAEAKARFIREAKAASSLEHTNICNIHDIDETAEGRLFIAMSCYDGESLKDKIERGPLSIEEAVDYAIQIAQGLSLAHEAGIIHRDIKPGNVMITGRGVVKIVDFGLAKMAESSLTKTVKTLGTAMYMSPEQARGEAVDHRIDLWSLGVVLYEMLTGKQPFRADYEQAVMYLLMNTDPEPISALRPEVPASLMDVVSGLTKKKVTDRYADMGALLSELRSIQKQITVKQDSIEEKREPSIAVLAFTNMSADPEQEFFCDGISEEIINTLTQVRDLKVIARTSAFSFKGQNVDVREIGRKLDVEHLLEGSVRKAGDRLRITAQLVKVSDGFHIWSERFDREMDDVFAVQDEISLMVVDKLKIKLLRREENALLKHGTNNIEAYNLYLKGRYHLDLMTQRDLEIGLKYVNRSIETDPNFALGYALLSDYHWNIGYWSITEPEEPYRKAKAYLEKALDIDGQLAEAHTTLAVMKSVFEWDWEGAENIYKRGIELNPGSPTVYMYYVPYLASVGRTEEAISLAAKAVELDPLSPQCNLWLGFSYWIAGRFDESIVQLQKVIDLKPDLRWAYVETAWCYTFLNDYDKALAMCQRIESMFPDIEEPWFFATTAYMYAVIGNKEKATEILELLVEQSRERYMDPFYYCVIYIGRGDHDEAFEWLEKAYNIRSPFMIYCRIFSLTWFRTITDDSRYKSILQRLRLDF